MASETKAGWYRLDNTAKVYPVISTAQSGNMIRVAANLTDDIEPSVLQQAVVDCKRRFPTIYVKLKRGLFWYYYEPNEKMPKVKPEPPTMCRAVDPHANNGYYFNFYYYRNRVSLEIFHAVTDGRGASEFLKAVLYRYFELLGYPMKSDGLVLTLDQKPDPAETADCYVENYSPTDKIPTPGIKAYHIRGRRFPHNGLGAIFGKLDTEPLKALAKEHGASVSHFIAALLSCCIIETGDDKKLRQKAVRLCVPVDIRSLFASKSLRNFFLFFHTTVWYDGQAPDIDRVIETVKQQFQEETEPAKLQSSLNANVSLEKNIALKSSPLMIKWFIIKMNYLIGAGDSTTMTMSNLGIITLPDCMKPLVRDFEFSFDGGRFMNYSMGLVTYEGRTTISFSRRIYETELDRSFFTHLAEKGIDIEIQSNLYEDFI